MAKNKTPGVYIQEISNNMPSVAQVETAVPVFIGYTEKASLKKEGDLLKIPKKIGSILEYRELFGSADPEIGITINVNTQKTPIEIVHSIANPSNYLMFYSLQSFYANGGGLCYIVSVGDYSGKEIAPSALLDGLKEAGKVDEITLIVYPDGTNITPTVDYYDLVKQTLHQCSILKDRFTVCDVYMHNDAVISDVDIFRDTLDSSTDELKYGAAYYPYLEMQLDYQYNTKEVTVNKDGTTVTLKTLETGDQVLFNKLKQYINSIPLILPPSSAMVGIYARNDENRGVWKAPANVNVALAIKPTVKITDSDQRLLNVDVISGKSINAIRPFTGRGVFVWGARTLAGNDNEWRYVPVRRFFNMVEDSVKKASEQFVFEPNDANTWVKVRTMIENFLTLQWRAGALAGVKPEQAFYVRVGLGETMTSDDILNGMMIIEIGMAVVRPAEFIILKITQKMMT